MKSLAVIVFTVKSNFRQSVVANALIAAYGKNDTKATLEALNKFNDSIATAQDNTVKLIDQRRKSQGVSPLFGDTSRNVNVNY